jgi:hypothetical protein
MTYESNQQTAVIAVSQEDLTIIGDWKRGAILFYVDEIVGPAFAGEPCTSVFMAAKLTSRMCREVLRELKTEARESAEN